MLRVGITGGIGSGKSTVAQMFEQLGIPVFYADREAKKLMETNAALRSSIISLMGPQAYQDASLNRAYLAEIVFRNPEKLEQLNQLVHPASIQAAERWMSEQSGEYALKEAALLFESGSQEHLDFIVGVSAPLELRIKRTMKRDRLTREDVLARMKRQISETIKMRLCDTVIINDEKKALLPQVLELHERLQSMAKKQTG